MLLVVLVNGDMIPTTHLCGLAYSEQVQEKRCGFVVLSESLDTSAQYMWRFLLQLAESGVVESAGDWAR